MIIKATRGIAAFLVMTTAVSFVAAEEPKRLDWSRLLEYRDVGGKLRAVKTVADWEKRRAVILAGMQSVMGKMPGKRRRVELDIQVVETVDVGRYLRQLITYQSEPGSRTPAYLCIPKDVVSGKRKAAAILCLHPTDNKVGHKVVVGLGGRANRQYAAELAERGYVTLSPSYPHLADYKPDLGGLGYVSGTMKAIWDNSRGLDLLASLAGVDASKGFGVIGHSLGGHNAMFTAAFEPRLTVIVSNCGFTRFGKDDMPSWTGPRYMPRIATAYGNDANRVPFDFPEIIGTFAPRPFLAIAARGDRDFDYTGVEDCIKSARAVYRLNRKPGHLKAAYPDTPHDFPLQARRLAYKFLDRHLK